MINREGKLNTVIIGGFVKIEQEHELIIDGELNSGVGIYSKAIIS